jgi:hypothetical protein
VFALSSHGFEDPVTVAVTLLHSLPFTNNSFRFLIVAECSVIGQTETERGRDKMKACLMNDWLSDVTLSFAGLALRVA